MKVNKVYWKDSYCIGVDYIDEAHKTLFSILHTIMDAYTTKNADNYRHASAETIKYLKNYALEHFEKEEAYMRSIKYPGFPMHLKLHNEFKNVRLPQMERDLKENDYSYESVVRLVGMVSGWLTGHILIEDMAITGKISSNYSNEFKLDKMAFLDSMFTQLSQKYFGEDMNLFYERYDGEIINNPYLIEIDFKDQNDLVYKTIMVSELRMTTFLTGEILGSNVVTMTKEAVVAYLEFVSAGLRRALELIYPKYQFVVYQRKKLEKAGFYESFKEERPEYSPMWRCSKGLIGFCLYTNQIENNI